MTARTAAATICRTHQQIVSLAHHLAIEPLIALFPASLDKLAPETSSIQGELPLLVCADEAGRLTDPLQLLFSRHNRSDGSGGGRGGSAAGEGAAASGDGGGSAARVQFGAEQVILVYGDERRREVQALVGDGALVMTVAESKGLEFKVGAGQIEVAHTGCRGCVEAG